MHSVLGQPCETNSLIVVNLKRGLGTSKQHLRSSQQYLNGDYKLHAVESSTISDHCRTYALSDPNDIDFKAIVTISTMIPVRNVLSSKMY
ncbi:hypothetical protein QZH41_007141 [Actinostola sp. cb2023]|nr:hypothetical protein QZH41_007141 [Actinostola sp. cb2023]